MRFRWHEHEGIIYGMRAGFRRKKLKAVIPVEFVSVVDADEIDIPWTTTRSQSGIDAGSGAWCDGRRHLHVDMVGASCILRA